MAKPQPFYAQWNQAPRSAKNHGKHRRAGAPAHGHPVIGTDHGSGGSDQSVAWTAWNTGAWAFYEPGPPKPPAIPYAGIRTGEIIGHRLWWVIGGQLCSLAHRRIWEPGETISGNTEKPVDGVGWVILRAIYGGTYAFADKSRLSDEVTEQLKYVAYYQASIAKGHIFWGDWHPPSETATLVCGTIKMWGDVVEHERGYRSQYAKLNSIDEMYGPGDLHQLKTLYGAPH